MNAAAAEEGRAAKEMDAQTTGASRKISNEVNSMSEHELEMMKKSGQDIENDLLGSRQFAQGEKSKLSGELTKESAAFAGAVDGAAKDEGAIAREAGMSKQQTELDLSK